MQIHLIIIIIIIKTKMHLCVSVCLCVCVCVCVFQGRVQQLSKTQPLVEEMQTKIHSLEDAKGWLERRLKETEVPGPTQWNPS